MAAAELVLILGLAAWTRLDLRAADLPVVALAKQLLPAALVCETVTFGMH